MASYELHAIAERKREEFLGKPSALRLSKRLEEFQFDSLDKASLVAVYKLLGTFSGICPVCLNQNLRLFSSCNAAVCHRCKTVYKEKEKRRREHE